MRYSLFRLKSNFLNAVHMLYNKILIQTATNNQLYIQRHYLVMSKHTQTVSYHKLKHMFIDLDLALFYTGLDMHHYQDWEMVMEMLLLWVEICQSCF